MTYKFFVGVPHHKVHLSYFQSLLGGEYVFHLCDSFEKHFPDKLLEQDGKDIIWLFSNWYPALHPLLVGKQIFVEHGLSFKPSLNKVRVDCINNHFDMVFSSGVSQRDYMLRNGVLKEKIEEIGYTTLFQIPNLPVRKGSVLFSVVSFQNWNEYKNLEIILERLDESLHGYVTLHPIMQMETKKIFNDLCEQKANLTLLDSQEQLLEAFAYCECIVGSSSSVCTPFWFLDKPVIFIRGKQGRNPFIGWSRIKEKINYPLFNQVLEESTRLNHWRNFEKKLSKAKISTSAKKIFFKSNWDKEQTNSLIKTALDKLIMRSV